MIINNKEDLKNYIRAHQLNEEKILIVVYDQQGYPVADAIQDYDYLCMRIDAGYITHKDGYLWYVETSNYDVDELNQMEGIEGCSQQYRSCEPDDYPKLTETQIKQAYKNGEKRIKIIQRRSVCGTECMSYHEWDSLEEFLKAELDEPEFEHDEGERDCGGKLTYEEAR